MSKNTVDNIYITNDYGEKITIYKEDIGLCFDVENNIYETCCGFAFSNANGKEHAKQAADALYEWLGITPAQKQHEEIANLKQQNQKAKEIIKRFYNYFAKGTPDLADAREFLGSGFSNS